MNAPATNQRLVIVDQFRGIAVILMAIFHFSYNLGAFGFIEFSMRDPFFIWFRFVIVTLFFLSIGAGLYLAHLPQVQWKKFAIRQLKIGAGALYITVSTYIMYPNAWVYFGVLQFIFIASIVALPFIRIPLTAAVIGVLIFVLYNVTDWFNLEFIRATLREPLNLPSRTIDLTRFIPWFGMVLIGIYFAKMKFWGVSKLPLWKFDWLIHWLSKHALIFYLVHQIPLYGIAWVMDKIFHP